MTTTQQTEGATMTNSAMNAQIHCHNPLSLRVGDRVRDGEGNIVRVAEIGDYRSNPSTGQSWIYARVESDEDGTGRIVDGVAYVDGATYGDPA